MSYEMFSSSVCTLIPLCFELPSNLSIMLFTCVLTVLNVYRTVDSQIICIHQKAKFEKLKINGDVGLTLDMVMDMVHTHIVC